MIRLFETKVLVEMLNNSLSLRVDERNPMLVQSIKERGYLVDPKNSVKIHDNKVISGRSRILSAQECGILWLPVEVLSYEDMAAWAKLNTTCGSMPIGPCERCKSTGMIIRGWIIEACDFCNKFENDIVAADAAREILKCG